MKDLGSIAPETEDFVMPRVPESIEEAGLSQSTVEQLTLKMFYSRGDVTGSELAKALGLKFSIVETVVEDLKRQHFIQLKRSLGMGNITAVFGLTDAGRNLTREFLENNQYTGPAPVPLSQYTYIVRAQRLREGWLKPDTLAKAYSKMVVSDRILSQIGPAVSSGNSFLIYGNPGNGKTYLAEALFNLETSNIYVPYAIEFQGTIVQVYDPVYHEPLADDTPEPSVLLDEPSITLKPSHDQRWFKCRRPFIVSGGELSLEMLDLNYNPVSKVYDAPFQVKANNGIYLIDDFGRSRVTPAEVLNRWIVPMERKIDYLTFVTGGKMMVPFEAFLIFSTNLNPKQLGDEAFLRRIQYKMLLRSPDSQEFTDIFHQFCASRQLPFCPKLVHRLLERHYKQTGKPLRRCHPRDLLSHAINLIHFENRPFELTDALIDRAFESCFSDETDDQSEPFAEIEMIA
jgi:DNA-binding MarR family transcriptional regulator